MEGHDGWIRAYSLIMRLPNLLSRKLTHPVVSAGRRAVFGHEAWDDEGHLVGVWWGNRKVSREVLGQNRGIYFGVVSGNVQVVEERFVQYLCKIYDTLVSRMTEVP